MDQRAQFVLKAQEKQVPFRELCEEFGLSPKTGDKWLERFRAGGLAALYDQSTRPQSSPAGLSEDVVCRIVALKQAHPHWGPRKIRVLCERARPDQNGAHERMHRGMVLELQARARGDLDQQRAALARPAHRGRSTSLFLLIIDKQLPQIYMGTTDGGDAGSKKARRHPSSLGSLGKCPSRRPGRGCSPPSATVEP